MNRGLLFVWALALMPLGFAQDTQTPPPQVKAKRDIETASARIEQVFKAEDDGYQTIAYQVIYHGQRVIVEDTLCSTDYAVGDKIYFLVLRHDMSEDHPGGKKLLHFMVR